MEVYVKEVLHVLDYQDNIVDTIFNSDDHRTPGYAYDISIVESNTGYSDLKFSMPNTVLTDKGDKIKNPKLALLTPLVKLRYQRQVYYTGEKPIKVREPQGAGPETVYVDAEYKENYLENLIEDYIMDYIVQPVDKKRDVLKLTTTFTAMDYPRFNLSKKRVGLAITQDTLTKPEWSLYKNEPIDQPGVIKYVRWTSDLSTAAGNPNIPLEWDPEKAKEYPLNKTDITKMMQVESIWPYGYLATAFYWPIVTTARFNGVLYKENGWLVLHVYDFYNLTTEGIDPELYVDRYSWEWTQLYEVDYLLCPNNAANYLHHILEGTNWTVAKRINDQGEEEDDVDIVQTQIPNPRGSTTSKEWVDKTSNINITGGNCYNAITSTCQALQLYPVFDCVNRTVALHQFAGKNYGLVYALGRNIGEDSAKLDGEKVITKLYCSGGKDYNGDANINIGTAERSYLETFAGFYQNLSDVPSEGLGGSWVIIDDSLTQDQLTATRYELQDDGEGMPILVPVPETVHDTSVKNYWDAGDNRKVYYKNPQTGEWTLGEKQPSGLWEVVWYNPETGQIETAFVDPETGSAGAEWNPNDDMYINSRSPYGTNYILNLRWAYQNNWITKEQILELYQYEKEIDGLNQAFMDKYKEDYVKTRQLYNEAMNNYDIAQDGYESTLHAMENKYYNDEDKISDGYTCCFHKVPLGTYEKTDLTTGKTLNYLKLGHCYDCGATEPIAVENNQEPAGWTVCPKCGSTNVVPDNKDELGNGADEIYIPKYDDFEFNYNESMYPWGTDVTHQYDGHRYNPHLKGYFQRLVMALDRNNKEWTIEDYENRIWLTKIIDLANTSEEQQPGESQEEYEKRTAALGDGYKYILDDVYVRAPSGQIQVWNDAVEKYISDWGKMQTWLKEMLAMRKRIEALDQLYEEWSEKVSDINATIQEKFGDYLIEGNYTNDEQPYINLLFQEGMEASDKYSIPEVTYNLNVIDSSGLVEYRKPTVTRYRCAECDYVSYTPINVCPRCANQLIVTETDVYNDLVKTLHSVGQIVPKAGDYVTIYDEPMGFYGVSGLITQISRYPDYPMNNKIEINTSYEDDEELVGNIITATNTVLNNADIYARTAVLKTDGTIDADSIRESIDNVNTNISIVSTNGGVLLDGSGLRATDPTNPNKAMKYTGTGIFKTTTLQNDSDEGAVWEKMMTPEGINATYINSGTIDTNKLTIMSGLSARVMLDQYGLSVKANPAKSVHVTEFDYTQAKNNANYAKNWGTENNMASFIGVDNKNNPLIYTKGMLVAETGSNIAGWITDENGFYHLNGNSQKDLWLSPTGLKSDGTVPEAGSQDETYSIYSGNTFKVTPGGKLYSTSGQIGGWTIGTNELSSSKVHLRSQTGDTTRAIEVNNGNASTFYVQNNGYMNATNANITGNITTNNITATGGTIGGWNISSVQFQKQIGDYSFEIRSDRGASEPALLVYKNQGGNEGYKFYVRPDGYLYATSGYISGGIVGSGINANNITAGRLTLSTGSGGQVSFGNGTTHLQTSGLNLGLNGVNAGITMNQGGISGCSNISNDGNLYIASYSGVVRIGHSTSGDKFPINIGSYNTLRGNWRFMDGYTTYVYTGSNYYSLAAMAAALNQHGWLDPVTP